MRANLYLFCCDSLKEAICTDSRTSNYRLTGKPWQVATPSKGDAVFLTPLFHSPFNSGRFLAHPCTLGDPQSAVPVSDLFAADVCEVYWGVWRVAWEGARGGGRV